MNKSLITHVLPGKTVPRAYLNRAMVQYPTVFGFAVQHEGKIEFEVSPKMWPVEQIEELLNGTMTSHRVLFMANFPKFDPKTDIQPFTLRNENDEALLAIFMEGDTDFAGLDGDHTEEYNASDAMVFPEISKAYEKAEDTEKFYELLRTENTLTRRVLMKVFNHRGVYCLLPREGEPIAFGNNELGASYPWGHSSQGKQMGYVEAEAAPPKEEKKVVSFMDKLRGKSSPPSAEPPPVPKTDTSVKAPPPDTGTKVDETGTLVFVKPPSGLQGKARNTWLRMFNDKVAGQLPPNHESKEAGVYTHPKLVDLAKKQVSDKKAVERLEQQVINIRDSNPLELPKDFPAGEQPTEKPQEEKKPITTAPDKVADKPAARSGVRESVHEVLGILSKDDKEKSMEKVASYLDTRSEKQKSPLEIQKMESKWPVFSSEIGLEFNELLFVTPDQWLKLFDGNKIATAAFLEMKRKYIDTSGVKLEDLVRGSTKPEEGAVNTEAANDKPVKTPSEAAPPAAKKGGLSWLKKTA